MATSLWRIRLAMRLAKLWKLIRRVKMGKLDFAPGWKQVSATVILTLVYAGRAYLGLEGLPEVDGQMVYAAWIALFARQGIARR